MKKIVSIISSINYTITCEFNDGVQKTIDIEPLINNHLHLKGASKILDFQNFSKVKMGELGELKWENIIEVEHKGVKYIWDYDISPEFIYEN